MTGEQSSACDIWSDFFAQMCKWMCKFNQLVFLMSIALSLLSWMDRSVGCTVIELLTGKPPYFDLQQMPALFRIVQDEHPPLPDHISSVRNRSFVHSFIRSFVHWILARHSFISHLPIIHPLAGHQALEDFLMQCFQKDPLRRISAADLLKHSWLKQAQDIRTTEMQQKLLQEQDMYVSSV